jgi:PhnB protein
MKELNIYLHFNGNARQALEFYKKCFGGEIMNVRTYGDSPMEATEEQKDKILHAEFKADEVYFMAADGLHEDQVKNGNHISLSVNMDSEEEQTKLFEKLSEGGKIHMPLDDTFWGARFGMLEDKFGVNWMVNVSKE